MNRMEKFYSNKIYQYPSLYLFESFDRIRLATLDQLLNVIGNGVETNRDFSKEFKQKSKIHYTDLINEYTFIRTPYHIIQDNKLMILYNVFDSYEKHFPEEELWVKNCDVDSYLSQTYMFHELVPPQQKYSAFEKNNYEFSPYPNFEKQYSVLWEVPDIKLNKCQIDDFIWFYNKCLEYFDSENVVNYHHYKHYKSDGWKVELERIKTFCNDTIDLLESKR